MGVAVTSTAGTPYTWATGGFAWNDPEAAQSWTTAAPQSYALAVSETWQTAEVGSRGLTKALAEAWHTAELRSFTKLLAIAEAWRTVETRALSGAFSLMISEGWTTAEAVAKVLPALNLAEGFHTADTTALDALKAVAEGWTTAEAFSSVSDFLRAFSEGWTTVEAVAKDYDLNVAEALAIIEFLKRHANGVISDVLIQAADMDLAAFSQVVDNGRAPGFTSFQDFIAGDYAYQSAVFRAIMEATTGDRGVIDTLSVQVDVPDVFDGGTAQILSNPSAGVAVNFARTFNVIPELTFSLKGGTGAALAAVPTVLGQPTKTGFTVALQDPSGNYYTGSLTWAARGY